MLTEEHKRGLEWLYNGYSFNKRYASKFKTEEWSAKMMALRCAVSILGYKFKIDCTAKLDGIEYIEYKLVEIGM